MMNYYWIQILYQYRFGQLRRSWTPRFPLNYDMNPTISFYENCFACPNMLLFGHLPAKHYPADSLHLQRCLAFQFLPSALTRMLRQILIRVSPTCFWVLAEAVIITAVWMIPGQAIVLWLWKKETDNCSCTRIACSLTLAVCGFLRAEKTRKIECRQKLGWSGDG